MNDKKFLAQHIKDLKASVDSYSPSPQNQRNSELWVANSFMKNLCVPYQKSEFIIPSEDPPDIVFRDAHFEIKEILDPDRRRHDEYKQELKMARTLTRARDAIHMFDPQDMSLQEIYKRCEKVVLSLNKKYSEEVKNGLDILLYVNLMNVVDITEHPYPDVKGITDSGWRSISFVMGFRSCCFYARDDAPSFLKQVVGCVSHLHPR